MIGIIPAAGLGTRLKEISKGKPKELLPVRGKPMIKWAIEELEKSGVSEIVVIISPAKKEIKEYLCNGVTLPLQFIYQPEPLGLADAIYRCKEAVKGGEFVVSLPDNIFIGKMPSVSQLIPVVKKYNKNVIALTKISSDNAPYFGNCGSVSYKRLNQDIFEITEIGDKKPGYFSTYGKSWVLRYFSRYVFQASVFDYIEEVAQLNRDTKEFDDIPVLQYMARKGVLLGVLLEGKVFDVGNPRGYQFCNSYQEE